MPPRPLRALTWIASLAGLLGCATPRPAPPAAEPPQPAMPATYTMSFVYEPTLTLRLLRDGQPYSGEATLTVPSTERQSGEATPLLFREGQTRLDDEVIARFLHKRELGLTVEGRELSIPRAGDSDPFECIRSIEALQKLKPCNEIPPSESIAPDHCDSAGQQAWRKARNTVNDEAVACWSTPDEATLARLRGLSGAHLGFACGRLIETVGDNPPDDEGIKLAPLCLPYFQREVRTRLDQAYTIKNLPAALETAKGGNSQQMRAFYHRYKTLAPEQAEQIRALAEQKFGPPDRARFMALRKFLEAQRSESYRATLCELRDGIVEVADSVDKPARYSQRTHKPDMEFGFVPSLAYPPHPMQRPPPVRDTRGEFETKVRLLVQSRTQARQVIVRSMCTQGLHWYLAETPG